MSKLTKEEVLKKTSEILKQPDLNLDYITQELVDSDSEETIQMARKQCLLTRQKQTC